MRRFQLGVHRIACITVVMLGWFVNSWSAEPVTPIGFLLANPSASHRKVLKLEGIAKDVVPYSGYEAATHRPICGADFKLEDDTGEIKVNYHAWCAAGQEQANTVVEGSRVIVEGSMEAPSTMLRTYEGKELGFSIFARTVTPAVK